MAARDVGVVWDARDELEARAASGVYFERGGLTRTMIWLALLGLVAIITAIAAVTGIKPKGTQHLAHTRLIGMARIVLLLLAILLIGAYFASRAHSRG
ncbi:MAG: hypothetical protein ABIU54_02625 [Candidatus Eisenbacteria bacterium]